MTATITKPLSRTQRKGKRALTGPQALPETLSPTQALTDSIMKALCDLAEMHIRLHEARNAEIVGIFCQQWAFRVKEIARQERKKAES